MTVATAARGFLQSPAMQEAVRGLRVALAGTGGVLIAGEDGTGRELFARAIHSAGGDFFEGSVERLLRDQVIGHNPNRGAFIVLDCSRDVNVEERLFGCDVRRTDDLGELDHIASSSALCQVAGGTLVLRQVADLARRQQARLANILKDGEAWAHSEGHSPILVRIRPRVIATIDVRAEGGSEKLHPELEKRVAGTTIHIPALRDRREDIPALARHLLAAACVERGTAVKTLSNQAAALLAAMQWRGNINELKGLVRVLAEKVPGRLVRLADVLSSVRLDGRPNTFIYAGTLREARERFEREYVAHILEQHHGRMGEAAKALGIQRTNLYRKVRQLAVQRRRPGRLSEI